MLKNYLAVAVRNLTRYKVYTAIKVFGLALGVAAGVLMLMYVQHESSYDAWHKNADRTYRVAQWWDYATGERDDYAATSGNLAELLLKDHPEIEAAIRFKKANRLFLSNGSAGFHEQNGLLADANVFDLFSFPVMEGDAATALVEPNTIVLTERLARKYFGNSGAIGQTLILQDTIHVKVTAVLEDVPSNSHITFDYLLPMDLLRTPEGKQEFGWTSFYTYVRLAQTVTAEQANNQILDISDRYIGELQITMGLFMKHYLQPLPDIYLSSNLDMELSPTSSRQVVHLFSAIGILILVIACINFVNIATAQSAQRSREVGMRKVIGARRSQLVAQFLGESLLLSLLALIIAVGLILLGMPQLEHLAGKRLDLAFSPSLFGALVLVSAFVGLASGAYPALEMSGHHPLQGLKPGSSIGSFSNRLRKGLVTFQFTTTALLITGTVVVYSQLDFLRSRDLGFDREKLVVVSFVGNKQVAERADFWIDDLSKLPGVLAVTRTVMLPGRKYRQIQYQVVTPNGKEMKDLTVENADQNFVRTYGLEIIAGTDFDPDRSSKTKQALANETMARYLGWGNELVGRIVNEIEIVGIVNDFHITSLRAPIRPMWIQLTTDWGNYFILRVAGDVSPLFTSIRKLWQQHGGERPLDMFFLDDDFNRQYRSDERMTSVLATFSGLGILIACLGLWGLAAFTAERRTKELGIRKAVGASVSSLLIMLTGSVSRSVLIGNALALPLAYAGAGVWLQDFAVRMDIGPTIFLPALISTLVIALLTVGGRSLQAARINPVEALRYE